MISLKIDAKVDATVHFIFQCTKCPRIYMCTVDHLVSGNGAPVCSVCRKPTQFTDKVWITSKE